MSNRLVLLSLLTAAALALAVWSALGSDGRSQVAVGSGTPVLPELTQSGARPARVEIETPDYSLALSRGADGWFAIDHGAVPVSEARITRLTWEAAALRRWSAATALPERHGILEVADPAVREGGGRLLRFEDADGAILGEVIVGRTSEILAGLPNGGVYVRRPGDVQTWLAEGVVSIPATLGAWIEPIVRIPGPQVQAVAIFEDDELVFRAAKPEGSDDFALEVLPAGADVAEAEALNDAIKTISRGIVSADASDVRAVDDLAFVGPARRIRFELASQVVLTVTLRDADGETWAVFHAEPEASAEAAAVNHKAQGRAFLLDSGDLAALQTPVGDLYTIGDKGQ